MGLRDLRQRLTASTTDLHHGSLRATWDAVDSTPIADVVERRTAVVGGEVQGSRVVPRANSPALEITMHDGTGRAVAVFTGRRSIGGITPGRRMLVEGVPRREGAHLVFVNPAYTLLP